MEAPKHVNRSFTGAVASTHWSAIRACVGKDQRAQAAREELCRDYWYPVYTYVRRFGEQISDAEDLTQDFFAYILHRPWLEHADKSKGRFRSFLLGSLNNFLRDQRDIRRALKREGSYRHIPWDLKDAKSRYAEAGMITATPTDAYDIEWAGALVDASLRKLEAEYVSAGKLTEFSVLKPLLTTQGDAATYEEIATQLHASAGGIKVAVHRLRKAYGAILRDEVARTVSNSSEVVQEMRYVREVFAARITAAA